MQRMHNSQNKMWVLKSLILILMILPILEAKANNYTEPVFPKDCQQNVTRTPIIHIRTDYPVDESSLTEFAPWDMTDSTNVRDGNFFLIPKEIYDNEPDSVYVLFTSQLHILLEDSVNIKLVPQFKLDYDLEYALVIKDNLKLLKPNGSGTDTVSTATSYSCMFKTLPPPYEIANTNLDNGYIHCNDTIKINFNRKLDLSQYQLDNSFQMFKINEPVEKPLGVIEYSRDTLEFSYSLSNDSSTVNIVPAESELGEDYLFTCSLSFINGNDSFGGFVVEKPYSIPSRATIQFLASPVQTSDTLPTAIRDINGPGQRTIKDGDTVLSVFPMMVDDFVFSHWEGLPMLPGIEIEKNVLRIIGSCENIEDIRIFAKYIPVPIDTLVFDTLRVDEQPHTCSKYRVYGYLDSLNEYTYTYKRYSGDNIYVDIDPCDDFEFLNWSSPDTTIDGSTSAALVMGNDIWYEWVSSPMGPQRRIVGGGNMGPVVAICTDAKYKFVVQWARFKDMPSNEFNGEFINQVFKKFEVDGGPQFLNLANDSTAIFELTKSTPSSVELDLETEDCYAISYLHSRDRHIVLERNQYMNENQIIDLNETFNSVNNGNTCENVITIHITRRAYKFTYFVKEEGLNRMPPLSIARLDIPDGPEWMNEPKSRNNSLLNATYEKASYTSKQVLAMYHGSDVVKEWNVTRYYSCKQPDMEVTAVPFLRDGIVTVNKHDWNLTTPFEEGVEVNSTLKSRKFTLDYENPPMVQFVFRQGFILKRIGVFKRKSNDISWYIYNDSWDDGEYPAGVPEWDSQFQLDEDYDGDGVRFIEGGGDGVFSHTGHHKVPRIHFEFSKMVDEESLLDFNNIEIFDHNQNALEKRKSDGFPHTKYPLYVSGAISNTIPIAPKTNVHDYVYSVALVNYVSNGFGGYGVRKMPHNNPYIVSIQSKKGNTQGKVILSTDLEELLNVDKLHSRLNSRTNRHTSLPKFRFYTYEYRHFWLNKEWIFWPTHKNPYPHFAVYNTILMGSSDGDIFGSYQESGYSGNYKDKRDRIKYQVSSFRVPEENTEPGQSISSVNGFAPFSSNDLRPDTKIGVFPEFFGVLEEKKNSWVYPLLDIGTAVLLYYMVPVNTAVLASFAMGAAKYGFYKFTVGSAIKEVAKNLLGKTEKITNLGTPYILLEKEGSFRHWQENVGVEGQNVNEIYLGRNRNGHKVTYEIKDANNQHRWELWGVGRYGMYSDSFREQISSKVNLKVENGIVVADDVTATFVRFLIKLEED